jgi:hypothetical protein
MMIDFVDLDEFGDGGWMWMPPHLCEMCSSGLWKMLRPLQMSFMAGFCRFSTMALKDREIINIAKNLRLLTFLSDRVGFEWQVFPQWSCHHTYIPGLRGPFWMSANP